MAHVGALTAFEEAGYEAWRIAGTSAGALVAALFASGMTAENMAAVFSVLDPGTFRDAALYERIPLVGPLVSVASRNGIYEGDRLHGWLTRQLEDLGVRTFRDLRLRDRAGALPPARSYKLVVVVTDITRGELIRLPWDYRDRYGLDPDEQPVADAVRASVSLPIFYKPPRLQASDATTSALVDGGVLSNFPIDIFDRTDLRPPRWPTFGITLLPRLPADLAAVFPGLSLLSVGPVRFLEDLVATMVVGRDQARLELPWVAARTIALNTDTAGILDFDASRAVRDELFAEGLTRMRAFLETWDFAAYKRRFRRGAVSDQRSSRT